MKNMTERKFMRNTNEHAQASTELNRARRNRKILHGLSMVKHEGGGRSSKLVGQVIRKKFVGEQLSYTYRSPYMRGIVIACFSLSNATADIMQHTC